MELSGELAQAGYTPDFIRTVAEVHIDPSEGGFTITEINLQTDAKVPGIDNATFLQIANQSKLNCPVSRALAAISINLDARLVQE
jgi:osmotically inducible protein OsmC